MPSEKDNTFEYNEYLKLDNIYANIEFLIKKNEWMCKQSKNFFNNKNR